MTIEQAVRTRALAHPGLAALLAERMHYGALPEKCPLPALVFFLISDPHDHITDLGHARIQFTSWGSSYMAAAEVDRQVDDAFTRFKGVIGDIQIAQGVTVAGPYDLSPEIADGQARMGRARDVLFHYRGVI